MVSSGSSAHCVAPVCETNHALVWEQEIHLYGCADLWDHLSLNAYKIFWSCLILSLSFKTFNVVDQLKTNRKSSNLKVASSWNDGK